MNYFIFPDFRLICNWPSAKLKRPDWKKYFSTFYCVLCIIVGSQIFWIYWQNPVGVKAAYLTQHCSGTGESGDVGCGKNETTLSGILRRLRKLGRDQIHWSSSKSVSCVCNSSPHLHLFRICSEKLELIISTGWSAFTHTSTEGSHKKLSRSMAEENQDDLLGPCRLSMVL